MIIYRLTKQHFLEDLSGLGAKQSGGRWNQKGSPVIYTAQNSSLAILETLVHVDLDLIPNDLFIGEIEIKNASEQDIFTINDLPNNWSHYPSPDFLKEIGETWLTKKEFLLLKVPSAINPLEYNYLVNPEHKNFDQVSLKKSYPFQYDGRLID